jgi:8-oxo-dGTP pyrophosphatase MutT (NUDIX family)
MFEASVTDLCALDSTALRELIRGRLAVSPGSRSADDWRYGPTSPARRAALRGYFPSSPVPAAVLLPIVEREQGLTMLLTQRASHLTHHAGQISFPGGRVEAGDVDPVATALRETEEEIGLPRSMVSVAGYLPDHLVVTGYRVTPVVGFVTPGFALELDPTEVDDAFEVPLAFLLDGRNHVPRVRRFEGHDVELIDMPYGERNIWGATADMLLTLYRLLRGEDA